MDVVTQVTHTRTVPGITKKSEISVLINIPMTLNVNLINVLFQNIECGLMYKIDATIGNTQKGEEKSPLPNFHPDFIIYYYIRFIIRLDARQPENQYHTK